MTKKRDIKFRIWDIKESKYLEESVIWSAAKIPQELSPGQPPFVPFITVAIHSPHHVVQQFIGCKDRNGKEIYEGDILNTHNWGHSPYFTEVFFCERTLGFKIKTKTQKFDNFPHSLYLEVIGNIFENPELCAN